MNYKKTACFLVILFCLIENSSALAVTQLMSCPADRGNQRYVCLRDTVEKVKAHLEEKIFIVGYGSAKRRTPGTGMNVANSFRQDLIEELKEQNIRFNESMIEARDGGHHDESWIIVYAGTVGE